ncbi:MAG: hypothetical protein FWG26_02675 [Betaproteobacteria bacterium]|nr:hypothetical protein [Betaproteobacteria bacterium]
MKRFFFFLLMLLLASSQAMACRCQNPEPESAYTRADAVVLVKIREVTQVQENVERMETEVLQSWKLKVTEDSDTLVVFSRANECPYVGQKGETHLLYLYLEKFSDLPEGFPEGFWTGNCVGNWPESYPQAIRHIQWLNRYGKRT